MVLGLGRRSLGGSAIALVGGWLSYRAVRGQTHRFRASESDAATGGERRDAGAVAGDRQDPESSADQPTVAKSVTIGTPADELAELLRDPETLDRIVGRFAEVSSAGDDRQRWTARGPLDRSLSWETRVVAADSGERLRWESVDGRAPFDEWSASFRPAPGDRGTEVTFRVHLDPPGGRLGDAATERLGVVPESLVGAALDRFKSLAETGEIPTLERNPSARGTGDLV